MSPISISAHHVLGQQIGALGAWIAAAVLLHLGAAAPGLARPNVLFLLTDDQGYGDLSIHGNPYLNTPNIDDLAGSGIRFDRFYVSSFCAPTRAALLTGRYPLRCGVWGVTHNAETMRSEEVTLAETLRAAGYRTACIGKWHNGEQYPFTPPGQGFDVFFGFCNGHITNYFDATLIRGSKPEPTTGYIADVLTDEAIRFIKGNCEGPFFCYVPYNTPHAPYQVPDKYFDKFAAKGLAPVAAAFYGMCENLDDNIGRLLAALKEFHLDTNTIVVFATDNGGTAGAKLYNAGMRGGKTSVHEGGCRVPLFILLPASDVAPRTISNIASQIDIYPTLLDLCDVPLPRDQPPVDGISLRPLIEGHAAGWPDRTLFTHNAISETNRYPGAVRTEQYRLVREISGPAGGSAAKENDASATPWQLYDMTVDPRETKDIASELPEIVGRLSTQYEAWFADVSKSGLERIPIPVGYNAQNPVTLQAHQAYSDGGIRYSMGAGAAHDFLTDWNDLQAKIWFEVNVLEANDYNVTLIYGCLAEDAGSTIEVASEQASVSGEVAPAAAKFIAVPDRDPDNKKNVTRDWGRLPLGTLHLAAGRQRITAKSTKIAGRHVMDFKGLELQKPD